MQPDKEKTNALKSGLQSEKAYFQDEEFQIINRRLSQIANLYLQIVARGHSFQGEYYGEMITYQTKDRCLTLSDQSMYTVIGFCNSDFKFGYFKNEQDYYFGIYIRDKDSKKMLGVAISEKGNDIIHINEDLET